MTEHEWLTTPDYLAQLIYLRGSDEPDPSGLPTVPGLYCSAGFLASGDPQRTSRRKLRMFAAAVCRRWWDLPLDAASQRCLTAYERFLAGEATWDWFAEIAAGVAADDASVSPVIGTMAAMWTDTPHGAADLAGCVACAVADHVAGESVAVTCRDATNDDWFAWSFCGGPPDPQWQSTKLAVVGENAPLLREIIGNPFRPVTPDPSWLTPTVVGLAGAIYENRAFHNLPVLADALEESGCSDAGVLEHCRGGGEHVRGCFVLDAILKRD